MGPSSCSPTLGFVCYLSLPVSPKVVALIVSLCSLKQSQVAETANAKTLSAPPPKGRMRFSAAGTKNEMRKNRLRWGDGGGAGGVVKWGASHPSGMLPSMHIGEQDYMASLVQDGQQW